MEKKNNDDKPKIAVALEYTPGEQAPKILATGRGYIAESIIEKAGEADVPVYADSKLADTLSKLEIGEMIPPEPVSYTHLGSLSGLSVLLFIYTFMSEWRI